MSAARYGALACDDNMRERTPDKLTIVMLLVGQSTSPGNISWTAITIASPVWAVGSTHDVGLAPNTPTGLSAWRLMEER